MNIPRLFCLHKPRSGVVTVRGARFSCAALPSLCWFLVLPVVLGAGSRCGIASPVPDDFPRFTVPGHEKEMDSLRTLFWRHYEPGGPLIPLWDEWMAAATLWPALGSGPA